MANVTGITDELVASFEVLIRRAFDKGLATIRDEAQFSKMVEFIKVGDVENALKTAQIDPLAFSEFQDAVESAIKEGGIVTAENIPTLYDDSGVKAIFYFNSRNLRAESILRRATYDKVVGITDDMRNGLRNALVDGMRSGTNPRRLANDIIGTMNPVTKKREGGILGLTAAQYEYVKKARQELQSGEKRLLRAYKQRARRDKRFDYAIDRAIASNEPLAPEIINKAINRYEDRLLKLRGETIGRTEALASLHKGQYEAMQQAIEAGIVDPGDVTKIWLSARDARVRDSHRAVDNGHAVRFHELFPNGLLYPGDSNGPPEEVINCRCTLSLKIDFLANL